MRAGNADGVGYISAMAGGFVILRVWNAGQFVRMDVGGGRDSAGGGSGRKRVDEGARETSTIHEPIDKTHSRSLKVRVSTKHKMNGPPHFWTLLHFFFSLDFFPNG